MNSEEFENIKKELEEIEKQNDKRIELSDERTRMSKVNSLEYKILTTLFFSMVSYVLLFMITLGLINNLEVSIITNIFPKFTYPIALIGSSFGVGTIARILFDKKYQIKERLKKFSNAKTEADKLEDEIYYQIELEKANNRNKVIKETIDILESKRLISQKISRRFDLNNKDIYQTKDIMEKQITELSTIIKEQYEKLDILTTQKVLCDRFWRMRDKFQKKVDAIMIPLLSGAAALFFTVFSALIVNLEGSIIPFFIGAVGSGAYMIKRNKDYKKVFNKFNVQLKEFALEKNRNKKFETSYQEKKEMEKLITAQIKDISIAEAQLQENKKSSGTLFTEDEKKKDALFKDYPSIRITEETRNNVLEHPELHNGMSVRERMGNFYTDEEWEKRREEVLNAHLSVGEKKTHKSLRKVFSSKNTGNK